MKIRGTDFVVYPVSDLRRATGFYRDLLGLPQEVYTEEWRWAGFNCGNTTLALHELKQRGVRVVKEPEDFSVCWAMEIADPDGNRVILHRRNDGTFGT